MEFFRRKWGRINQQTSLLYFEIYKLLIQQKKGIVVLLLVFWAVYSTLDVYDTQYYASSKEAAYHAYLVDLAGPITNEKLEYIENEKMRLQEIKDDILSWEDTTDVGTINKLTLQLELQRAYKLWLIIWKNTNIRTIFRNSPLMHPQSGPIPWRNQYWMKGHSD